MSKFQTDTIKKFKSKGWYVIKLVNTNKNGITDLLCLKQGKTLWIECKEENDTLKPLQKLRIEELRENGFRAYAIQKNKGIIF